MTGLKVPQVFRGLHVTDHRPFFESRRVYGSNLIDGIAGRGSDFRKKRRLNPVKSRQVARVEPIGRPQRMPLPDLSEFRASIRVKGKPMSQVVTEARGNTRY